MANPRVFISSTCYDLAEVRDTLVEFVMSFGFEPVLSERGDVFYHPDIHTHDSCINEVSNCQLFILIIGGRFGGTYKADTSKSIVNAEYASARESKIPVFTFVKRSVHSDHFVYQKNKSNKDIVFPSIDNNAHASKIFEFIDDVRLSSVNNGIFPFEFAREIADLLRKQWSGMFYEFLEERSNTNQLAIATNLLQNISVAGEKVEELVKSLYRHVDSTGADEKINSVEKRAAVRRFYEEAFSPFVRERLKGDFVDSLINTAKKGRWYEYFASATGGHIDVMPFPDDDNEGEEIDNTVIEWEGFGSVVDCPSDKNSKSSIESREQQKRFEIIQQMEKSELENIIRDLDFLNNG